MLLKMEDIEQIREDLHSIVMLSERLRAGVGSRAGCSNMGLATEPLRQSPSVPRVFFFTLQFSYSSPYSSHSYDQPFPDYDKPGKSNAGYAMDYGGFEELLE